MPSSTVSASRQPKPVTRLISVATAIEPLALASDGVCSP